ncbi:MAG: ATP-binding protein [Candidatus Delongbacteria bacterium]|nr:ATP-binding protein [Candidatus Delongbacteria bacterium]
MERQLINQILKDLSAKHISLIIGARQTGKTTLLKQVSDRLSLDHKSVFYITLEDREMLEMLDNNPKNLLQLIAKPDGKERRYVLIDEIQYLKDPSNFLKFHYDTYLDKIKFIVTGSSSFYIDRKFKDSLAGRKRIYELSTMSLKEVLIFKGEKELAEYLNADDIPLLYLDRIKEYFYEYLIWGGYPEAVLSGSEKDKRAVLKEIADSYAKKDAAESNLNYHDKYLNLMRLLASQTGGLLNINSLVSDVGLDNKTAAHYIWVMRKSFHIHNLAPFHQNLSSELRKMPKIYFADLGLRNTLINDYSPIGTRKDKGELFENYVYLILKSRYGEDNLKFWRTQDGNEIDFIAKNDTGDTYAYEVKYDRSAFKGSKYRAFTNAYSEIPLECISPDDALKAF